MNTFGKYNFPDFVPQRERELITDFWGWAGRTHLDWLADAERDAQEHCMHGPGANGFGLPPLYARAQVFINDMQLSERAGYDVYRAVEGLYVHRWNNIGSIICDDGKRESVSSCDRWIRIYRSEEEKEISLFNCLSPRGPATPSNTKGGAA